MKVRKSWKRRGLSLCVALLLLCGSLPLAISAAETGTPEDSIRALSQLVAENHEDAFFSSMVLTTGEPEAAIDGNPLPLAEAPAIEQGQALLPIEAIAAVREMPPETGLVSAEQAEEQSTLITQSEAENLGLQVQVEDDTILVTAPFQTRRLIVKTANGKLSNRFGASTVLSLPENRFVLQYDTEQAARDACLQLEATPSVLYAEPDGVLTVSETEAAEAVEAAALGWGADRIGSAAFQAILPANPPTITVAVLDSGIDANHPVFADRVSDARWNFVDNNNNTADGHSHGTHVAGIVADCTPSNVKIMPVKVLSDTGKGFDTITMEAVRYAVNNGAKVVNLSLSGADTTINSWNDTANHAARHGVTIFAATGNGGKDVRHYPAAIAGVIAVTSSTSANAPAASANYGAHADIGAPGDNIRSTMPGGGYGNKSGTSMATPHASAAAALLLSYQPNMPPEAILPYLQATSNPWATSTQLHGAGIINLTPRTITPRGLILDEGQSADLSYVFACPPVSYASASFTSNAPDAAAVTPDGGILGLRPGSAVVSMQSAVLSATVPVQVRAGGSIPKHLTLLYKKDYPTFLRTGNPGVFWKSSNSKVLVVNADGQVEFKGQGKATIYTMVNRSGTEFAVAETKVTVKYTFLQWLAVIFLFGWIWM